MLLLGAGVAGCLVGGRVTGRGVARRRVVGDRVTGREVVGRRVVGLLTGTLCDTGLAGAGAGLVGAGAGLSGAGAGLAWLFGLPFKAAQISGSDISLYRLSSQRFLCLSSSLSNSERNIVLYSLPSE